MEKKIAVITGASSGMGREFVLQLDRRRTIRRNLGHCPAAQNGWNRFVARCAPLCAPFPWILPTPQLYPLPRASDRRATNVAVLVNCSGYGKFGRHDTISLEETLGMIDLNCRALVAMTQLTLPHMTTGSRIYELDSLSAFQPVPYLNVYAASKAFVLSYSRGLNIELTPRGIRVMAVCPGWVKTEFFDRAETQEEKVITYFNHLYEADEVVTRALRDMKKGKDVSICGAPIRRQVRLVKLLPHKLVMAVWMKQQKLPK